MAKQASITYGNALFELALESGNIDLISEEVSAIMQVFNENEDINKLLNHPKISKEEKIAIMEKVFKDRISNDLLGLLVIMIKKDRHNEILKALLQYEKEVIKYRGIGIAYITSAVALSEKNKQSIIDRLLDTTQFKEIDPVYNVDESIIGGLIIRIDDRVVDSSIKTRIESLSKVLYQG